MNFDQIYKLSDKDPVDQIQGRVIRVHDPKRPSEAQARSGIHSQTVILQDPSGQNLKLQIMRVEQHFLPSVEGEIFLFREVNGQGLTVNRWRPRDSQDDEVCVQVDRQAHFYAVEQTKEQRQAYQDTKPQLGDLVSLYCTVLKSMEENLQGSEMLQSMMAQPHSITAAASTIFIEAMKRDMLPKRAVTTNLPAHAEPAQQPVESRPEKEQTRPVADNAIDELDDLEKQVSLLVVGRVPTDKIKALAKEQPRDIDFVRVYDHVSDSLKAQGWTQWEIDKAHDVIRDAISQRLGANPTDKQLYTTICYNFDRFEKARPQPPHGHVFHSQPADDDFLPTLD